MTRTPPTSIEVHGARVHNLADIDVSIPLGRLVGIAGVSGSGKSSLALGVLYAEGSRRYVEALSTYTRRRLSQAGRADVDSVEHVPAALALHQRPSAGGVRSTFGTSTELLNVLRLMFSRLASHLCPNGHRVPPTIAVAAETPFHCPTCGELVEAPGAESLAFNSTGACPTCQGTGTVRLVDDDSLVPDESLTIDEGAVVPWRTFGWSVQPDIAREFGVRTDVPWSQLSEEEKRIVLDGPEEKKHIVVHSVKGVHELDFTFRNARLTVTKELDRASDEKRLAKVSKFLVERTCPDCNGTRLSAAARGPRIGDLGLDEVTAMTLDEVLEWADTVAQTLPDEMLTMANGLVTTLTSMAGRLVELGLGYLTLDRASATLSTGERQRVQLARAVRNRTTGVLYVLDEPSIGLHPANVDGLVGVMEDLVAEGNSVVVVDHDVRVLEHVDHLVEIGPGSGAEGGRVIATGSVAEIADNPDSLVGPFLAGREETVVRTRRSDSDDGVIHLSTGPIHTVKELEVDVPVNRLTAVTGVSGSGKTTMVLDSLVPGLRAAAEGKRPPGHVRGVEAGPIRRVQVVDATPIGINVRSTVATYSKVMDELRRAFGRLPSAREDGLGARDFSHNTGSLRCPRCDGTGQVTLDVQFLPDIEITCPDCRGSRFRPDADKYRRDCPGGSVSLPQVLGMTVRQALEALGDIPRVRSRLQGLVDLGLGYLTLGEDTPALSGGEAQRLKLASELGRRQDDTLFVLDEPSVGLHPLDVRVLLGVLDRLLDHGASVVVIEHDLDMIANADHLIDMGPGGGDEGGTVVAAGSVEEIARCPESVTGRYL